MSQCLPGYTFPVEYIPRIRYFTPYKKNRKMKHIEIVLRTGVRRKRKNDGGGESN
jgi:hypothetical protein